MSFGKVYCNILSPFLKEYKSVKNQKERKGVINNAAEALLKTRETLEDGMDDLPNDLKGVSEPLLSSSVYMVAHLWFQAITRYIKGCIAKETAPEGKKKKTKKFKPKYTVRDVIKKNYRDRIEAEIPHEPSSKEYLRLYQNAVTKVWEKMDDEDLEEAETVLELWNKEGVPPKIQQR